MTSTTLFRRVSAASLLAVLAGAPLAGTASAGPAPTASFSGHVWLDLNENGRLDAGEPGVPGQSLYLLRPDGAQAGSVTSDEEGNYRFDDLAAGSYRLDSMAETNWAYGWTSDTRGVPGNRSVVGQVSGVSKLVTLSDGQAHSGADVGLVRARPDRAITGLTADRAALAVGQQATITLRVRNEGNVADNLFGTIDLPDGVHEVGLAGSSADGVTCSPWINGSVSTVYLSCVRSNGNVLPGDGGRVTVTVRADELSTGTVKALVHGEMRNEDVDPGNDTRSLRLDVVAPAAEPSTPARPAPTAGHPGSVVAASAADPTTSAGQGAVRDAAATGKLAYTGTSSLVGPLAAGLGLLGLGGSGLMFARRRRT